jgi:hypothetical protein
MSLKVHALLADRILLTRLQRQSTYATFALLLLTGLCWWALDSQRGENPASTPQIWLLRAHGGVAMLLLICFGSLLTAHVRIAWALQRNRVLGGTLIATVAMLTATGYGLYYSVGEAMRFWSSWIHFCVGAVAPVLLVVHIWRGRATRRALALAIASPDHEIEGTRA